MNDEVNDRKQGPIEKFLRRSSLIDSIYTLAERNREFKRSSSTQEQNETRDSKNRTTPKGSLRSLVNGLFGRSSKKTSEELRTSEIAGMESTAAKPPEALRSSKTEAHLIDTTSEEIKDSQESVTVAEFGTEEIETGDLESSVMTTAEENELLGIRKPLPDVPTEDDIEVAGQLDGEEMKAPDEAPPPPPSRTSERRSSIADEESVEIAPGVDLEADIEALKNMGAKPQSETVGSKTEEGSLQELTGDEAKSMLDNLEKLSGTSSAVKSSLEEGSEEQDSEEVNLEARIAELKNMEFKKPDKRTPPKKSLPPNPKDTLQNELEVSQKHLKEAEVKFDKNMKKFTEAVAHLEKAQEMKAKFEKSLEERKATSSYSEADKARDERTSKQWEDNVKNAQERVNKLQGELDNSQKQLYEAEDKLEKNQKSLSAVTENLRLAEKINISREQAKKTFSKPAPSGADATQSPSLRSAPKGPAPTPPVSWAKKVAEPAKDEASKLQGKDGPKLNVPGK